MPDPQRMRVLPSSQIQRSALLVPASPTGEDLQPQLLMAPGAWQALSSRRLVMTASAVEAVLLLVTIPRRTGGPWFGMLDMCRATRPSRAPPHAS
jgi:hypothetical protein